MSGRSVFDEHLAMLREAVVAEDCERVEVDVRADGRVYFTFFDRRGFHKMGLPADLDANSAHGEPNETLHRHLQKWSGR